MDLRRQRPAPTLQALNQHELPQRLGPIERMGEELARPFEQLPVAARGRQRRVVNVVRDVEPLGRLPAEPGEARPVRVFDSRCTWRGSDPAAPDGWPADPTTWGRRPPAAGRIPRSRRCSSARPAPVPPARETSRRARCNTSAIRRDYVSTPGAASGLSPDPRRYSIPIRGLTPG